MAFALTNAAKKTTKGVLKEGTKTGLKGLGKEIKKPKIPKVEPGTEVQEIQGFIDDFGAVEEAADTLAAEYKVKFDVPPKQEDNQENTEQENKKLTVKTKEAAKNAWQKVRDLPKPVGIGLLLLLIGLVLFAVKTVKVDAEGRSYTRLGLIWQTIIGQASIDGFEESQQKESTGTTIAKKAVEVSTDTLSYAVPGFNPLGILADVNDIVGGLH